MNTNSIPVALILGFSSLINCISANALDIETWHTTNGTRVLFVESQDLPIVDVRLTYRAGSARDGKQYGISRLVSALLVEGSGGYTAEEVAQTFESVGAQLGHNSLRDMAWTSLRSLSSPEILAKTVDMFAMVNGKPDFPNDAIERDRRSLLLSLGNRENEIESVVEDAFFDALYDDQAYEIGPHGTSESLESISRKDLLAFHRRYYVAKNATLSLVGDLTREQARQYAEKVTRHLKSGQPAQALSPAEPPEQGRTVSIQFEASQSHIKQGLPVLSRKDPDYFPLYVGNHILGGSGFSSRLVQEIRENRGLTYSVYSYFLPMETNGPFQMALQTRNDQVDEAGSLMQALLEAYIEDGPSEEELNHAKKNITGSFPLKLDSNKKIVNYLGVIGFYDLPLNYLDSFNQRVMAVTIDDIKDAFQRRVDPNRLVRVIVGDLS